MSQSPFNVASIGIGWWSDVLADAAARTDGRVEVVSCFTRSQDKRRSFSEKYKCRAAASLDEVLADGEVEGIINTTPNHAHLETTRAAAGALTMCGRPSAYPSAGPAAHWSSIAPPSARFHMGAEMKTA